MDVFGALSMNFAPLLMPWLVAVNEPPKIFAPIAQECRPKPWPLGFVVNPCWNNFLRFVSEMPMPVSMTMMLTDASVPWSTVIVMFLSGQLWSFIACFALLIRLTRIWIMACLSTEMFSFVLYISCICMFSVSNSLCTIWIASLTSSTAGIDSI